MDDKTEELREIFLDVSEEGTVTERQEESPGTLAEDGSVEERLGAVLERMRERYAFQTALEDADLVRIARGFYEDQSDTEIADALDIETFKVFRARLDLHLLKDEDRDAPFDFDALRRAVANDDFALGDSIDVEPETVDRYRAVADAEQEMRQANYRFRDQFDDILGDGDVAEHLTRDVTDDGLEDATEGLEINTAF